MPHKGACLEPPIFQAPNEVNISFLNIREIEQKK